MNKIFSNKKTYREENLQAFSLSIGSLLFSTNAFSYEPQYRFSRKATYRCIVEQIIPTDEWLGTKDAGVTNFIDKQLVVLFKI